MLPDSHNCVEQFPNDKGGETVWGVKNVRANAQTKQDTQDIQESHLGAQVPILNK